MKYVIIIYLTLYIALPPSAVYPSEGVQVLYNQRLTQNDNKRVCIKNVVLVTKHVRMSNK